MYRITKTDGAAKWQNVLCALSDRALPQGAPTSPALTNIVCLNLDRRLTGLAEKIGLRYSRYADDLTFSLPANSTSIKTPHSRLIITI